MAMDPTFAKLCVVGIVGGVAKALFAQPRPVSPAQSTFNQYVSDTAKNKVGVHAKTEDDA